MRAESLAGKGPRPNRNSEAVNKMIAARLEQLGIEEAANCITHGFGLLLSIAGFAVLLVFAVTNGSFWHIAGSVIYGVSLVTLYAASTLYHSCVSPEAKRRYQVLDHCCIYLLIAGSYTPFLLVALGDTFAFGLLAFVWSFALAGIAMKVIFRGRFNAVGMVSYLLMGWAGLFALQPLYAALGGWPLALVVASGLSYTTGTIFFGWKSLKHHHAIWHMFVLGGSLLHYLAVAMFVF
jgi:hemolysin III